MEENNFNGTPNAGSHSGEFPNAPSRMQYAATYGLYLGLMYGLIYVLGSLFPQSKAVSLICSLAQLLLLFVGYRFVRNYRDRYQDGFMSFSQGWTLSFWMFAFGALIMAVFHFVHFRFVQPTYVQDVFNNVMMTLEQTQSVMPEQLEELAQHIPTPIQVTFYAIWAYLVLGAFVGVFYGAIARRSDFWGNGNVNSNGDDNGNGDSDASLGNGQRQD